MTAAGFAFRPLARSDEALLSRWLATPEVARWFGGTDAAGMLESLGDQRVRKHVALIDDRPLGWVQDYDVHGWDRHPLGALAPGARGVDCLIGDRADIDRGLGPAMLAAYCGALFEAGTPEIGVDPHPDNVFAIRAYGKVGFLSYDEGDGPWGPYVAMRLAPASLRG